MKKKIYFLLVIGFCNQRIFSQENNKDIGNQKKYSLTIKSAHFSYLPSDFLEQRELNPYFGSSASSPLRNTKTKSTPLSLSYYSKGMNLFFEYSYYKATFDNMYYTDFLYFERSGQIFFSLYNLPTINRRENKLNAYRKYSINGSNLFFVGLGARNIFKEISKNNSFSESYIRSDTYGLELFFKYRLEFLSSFSFNITFEPFYTAGKLIRKDGPFISPINKSVYLFPIINGSFAYYWGYDTDVNLSYKIDDSLSFFIGYNYIRTSTRIQNRYQDNVSESYYISDINGLHFFDRPQVKYERTDDNIQNYYIGIKAEM